MLNAVFGNEKSQAIATKRILTSGLLRTDIDFALFMLKRDGKATVRNHPMPTGNTFPAPSYALACPNRPREVVPPPEKGGGEEQSTWDHMQ